MNLNFWKKEPKEEPRPVEKRTGEKPPKAKIYVSTERGLLLPWATLEKAKIQKSSKAIQDEKRWITVQGLIPKKYSPQTFINLAESEAILGAAIGQITEDTINDWRLVLKEGEKDDSKEKEEIEAFLSSPNDEYSLKDLLCRCVQDLLTVGGLDVEVVRNVGGKCCELWHVPDSTIFVHKDGKKLAQQRNNITRWFIFYQSDYSKAPIISYESGKEGDYDLETRGNELLRYVLYAPGENSRYGLPPLTPSIRNAITLLEGNAFHLSQFQDRGLPEYVVSLIGDFEEGSESLVTKFLRDMKGEHRRSMVITLGEGQTIKFDPVATEIKGDEFTLRLMELNRESVMASYRIPPSRLSIFTEKRGLSTGLYSSANIVYWESCIRPKQLIVESLVDRIIHGLLGRESVYHFELEDLGTQSRTDESKILQVYFSMGVYSVNDLRVKLGMETIKGLDDHYVAQQYVPITELSLKKRREEIAKGEAEIDTFMFELEGLRRELKAKQN